MKKENMTNIFNVRVYGLKESVIASGYPMIAESIPEMIDPAIHKNDFKRAIKLGTVPGGTGHDNFLKGIVVQFDITYPVYWSPQFQRYHFADIVSSTSAMHRINKVDLKECTNKYVSNSNNEKLSKWIEIYNKMEDGKKGIAEILVDSNDDFKVLDFAIFNLACVSDLYAKDKVESIKENTGCNTDELAEFIGNKYDVADKDIRPSNILGLTKYEVYMKIISNTPQGLMKTMRVTTNYLQLKTIYEQRKHHKLKEDWGYFCDWVKTLPYFGEFCIKGYATKGIDKYIKIIKKYEDVGADINRYTRPEAYDGCMMDCYLEFLNYKYVNSVSNGKLNIHTLYIDNIDPSMLNCYYHKDEDEEFLLVYPDGIWKMNPIDIKLEVIEDVRHKLDNGYMFKNVLFDKE
ncbi:MAG: hypothetical protein ACRCX8_16655 [Sarcina sp.]